MFSENKTTELKREYVDDIKNTAIAFANCDGGTLYVGIEDDGTVRGVDDADGTMLRVTNAIRDAVRPDLPMFLECRCETMEGKPVICVRVQRGTARPYSPQQGYPPGGCLCPSRGLHRPRQRSGNSGHDRGDQRRQLRGRPLPGAATHL